MTLYQLIWLFFCYSILGWVLEVLYMAVRRRRYCDRGVLNGPVCVVYGVAGCIITLGLSEIVNNWFFLFLFSALYATVVEWIAGHLLERVSQTRWWDYSALPFNLDGYICLPVSLLWGLLGVVVIRWGNPLLLLLFGLMPLPLRVGLIWVLVVLLALDTIETVLTIAGLRYKLPQVDAVGNGLANLTLRIGMWILDRCETRMARVHPAIDFVRPKRVKTGVFAQGCCFEKLFLLFVIGSLLGDIAETIFCRFTAGYWMSRSSLVWGPFSVVWGFAIAMVTQLLYRYKDRPASWLFVAGTLLGGAYEYLCSVLSELVFGAVFWDYSSIPFNLGGRINLLYCFFWGFAAVAWFKVFFPPISALIEKLPVVAGHLITGVLVVFMTVNMLVSAAALIRYDARLDGVPPRNSIEVCLDNHFDNDRMMQIYPKAKQTG